MTAPAETQQRSLTQELKDIEEELAEIEGSGGILCTKFFANNNVVIDYERKLMILENCMIAFCNEAYEAEKEETHNQPRKMAPMRRIISTEKTDKSGHTQRVAHGSKYDAIESHSALVSAHKMAPLERVADQNLEYIVTSDASQTAIGGYLAQMKGKTEFPINICNLQIVNSTKEILLEFEHTRRLKKSIFYHTHVPKNIAISCVDRKTE
ncbi:unnamed protein product [Trichogramma brassicae]|uniref:Uncharacterized protein n=1 Tax=Trichogramma brassicae TaxID=86971 RepID=A0A6H5J4F0_9HYME|nr:unnamed protein product [Trichogramma brassicae]